jgi:hypothetical protein
MRLHLPNLHTYVPLSLCFCCALAAQEKSPANRDYILNPDAVVLGKDYGLTITDAACPTGGSDTPVDAEIPTTGFTLTDVVRIKKSCQLTAKLRVSPDAPLGDVNIMLYSTKDRKADADKIPLAVAALSVLSIERGPIPPGLKPQVDVTWKVYPRAQTGHSFGRTVADLYFAIEVMIGNDSGYPLQIASIAFQPKGMGFTPDTGIPSDQYNFVRSTIEKEQQVGGRALVVNTA